MVRVTGRGSLADSAWQHHASYYVLRVYAGVMVVCVSRSADDHRQYGTCSGVFVSDVGFPQAVMVFDGGLNT